MRAELILDERIRNWVFLPLLYVMFMMGIIKMTLTKLMGANKPPEVKISEQDKIQENNEK